MSECSVRGCRRLHTVCADCGRVVIERDLPRFIQWISMKEEPPSEAGHIIFVLNQTDEIEIGIAIPEEKFVILRRTDIDFDDIQYWMPIPEMRQ